MELAITQKSTVETKVSTDGKHMKICEKIKHKYEELIDLAELDADDLEADECANAEYALEKVLKYGTYEDGAKAIHDFVTYVQLNNAIEFLGA